RSTGRPAQGWTGRLALTGDERRTGGRRRWGGGRSGGGGRGAAVGGAAAGGGEAVGGPVFGVVFGVGAEDLAVDRVELDEAPLGGGLVGGVQQHPPHRAAAQAPPGELGRGVANGKAGGRRRGGQRRRLVEPEWPGRGDVVDGRQGQEHGRGQQPAVAGDGRPGAAGGLGHHIAAGGDAALAVVGHLIGPGDRDVELLRELFRGAGFVAHF